MLKLSNKMINLLISFYKIINNKNQIRMETYSEIETLQENSNSLIKKVFCRETGKYYILKTVYSKELFERETEILSKLNHENIIKLHHNFIDFNKINNFNIVTPYYKYGDLFTYVSEKLNLLDIKKKKQIFRNLLQPIKYCHSKNIIHLDIKLENFILTDENCNNLILIDFGFSHELGDNKIIELNKHFGTREYVNPERKEKKFGKFTDIWCIGIILYILLQGEYLYKINNLEKNIKRKEDLIFLKKMINNNINQRENIENIINDDWLKIN